ncbi:MAG TPA: thiamine pyrophosphate-binding protein [Vicinamibacterales bacterium]|jgi:acetolactate synthase-1/2/3 large subunit|nr:thiamine pyrophosphate-binding protein [Vicinamibacterales bacterium]
MPVADLVVGQLLNAGVRTLFGVPGGGGNLDLIAAAGRAGLPFVLTSTETAAAIAALAQAEVTGAMGACLTTLGPGATSVVNGVACAFLERAPIVVFTDSQPAPFEHQRIDHAALMAPITKSSCSLRSDSVLQVLAPALHMAARGRPGPVHVNCPGDVMASILSEGLRPSDSPTRVLARRSAGSLRSRGSLATLARDLLTAARKPLLLVGLGARGPADAAAIRSLCSARNIAAMVTYKAKGVVPDDHPWFAGLFTNATIEQPMMDECDLLIGMGLDPVELIPRGWKRDQPIVYCGPWSVEDAHVPFAVQFVTDVASAAREIEALLAPTAWDPDRVRRHLDEQRRQIDVPADGLSSQRVVQIAAARLAAAGRVTVDAGAHMFPATMLWPVSCPNGMLLSNGLSTMGFALPAAIGAALLDRDRPVIALTGDGGLLMCAGELLTAAREKLRIITIVFSDASLSLIEIKQQARGLEPAGVALGAIDWQALAGSFGVRSWTATTEAELDRAAGEALACDGPTLIEAKIDRSNYGATLRAVRG